MLSVFQNSGDIWLIRMSFHQIGSSGCKGCRPLVQTVGLNGSVQVQSCRILGKHCKSCWQYLQNIDSSRLNSNRCHTLQIFSFLFVCFVWIITIFLGLFPLKGPDLFVGFFVRLRPSLHLVQMRSHHFHSKAHPLNVSVSKLPNMTKWIHSLSPKTN